MHSATRLTRSIYGFVAVTALLVVTTCSRQSTEPDEAEVWPPTAIPATSEPYCDPTQIQHDHIIVDFQPAITPSQADSFAAAHNLSFIEPVRYGNSYHYLLNDTTAITSHELAVQVRNESPQTVLWAEPTMLHRITFDSGTWYVMTLSVDILYLRLLPASSDSIANMLIERFDLKLLSPDRWAEYVHITDSLWREPPFVEIPFYFEIDRDKYGYNEFCANCLASLIHPMIGDESLPQANPIAGGGAISRFVRVGDSR